MLENSTKIDYYLIDEPHKVIKIDNESLSLIKCHSKLALTQAINYKVELSMTKPKLYLDVKPQGNSGSCGIGSNLGGI